MQAKGQSVLYLDRERTKERKKSLTESFGVCVRNGCSSQNALHNHICHRSTLKYCILN